MTYEIVNLGGVKVIRCLRCGQISYHPMDLENRYCGRCKVFHDDAGLLERAAPEIVEFLHKRK